MAKKKTTSSKPKKRVLTENEVAFCNSIIAEGLSMEEAYKNNWSVPKVYSPSRIRYEAKKIAKRPHVREYLEALLFERKTDKSLDEKFVLDMLKETAIRNKNTTIGVRSLELLGKYLGMFKERQIVEDATGHRATANKLFELAERMNRGEDIEQDVEKLEAKTSGVTTDDFEIAEDTTVEDGRG